MILVYEYYWGDESCSGDGTFVFEYESKEKFVFDVLEKFKDKEWKEYGTGWYKNYEKVQLFSSTDEISVSKMDVESIEHNVYTLEEWSTKNKKEVIL